MDPARRAVRVLPLWLTALILLPSKGWSDKTFQRREEGFPDRLIEKPVLQVTYRVSGARTGVRTLALLQAGRWMLLETRPDPPNPAGDTVIVTGIRQGMQLTSGDTTWLTPGEVFLFRYRWWVLFRSLREGRPPVPWVPWDSLPSLEIQGYWCSGVQTEWLGVPIRVWSWEEVPLKLEKMTAQGREVWEALQVQEELSPEVMQWVRRIMKAEGEQRTTKEVQP